MLIFGLVIVLLGVCILLAGLFATGYETEGSSITTELLQINMPPEVVFVFGVASGALILIGLWVMKLGAKQGWRHRKERKHLDELSAKLDQVEAERRAEGEQA